MDKEPGIDLSSLDGPPFHHEPNGSTTRMPFFGYDSVPETPQLSPEISTDYLGKGRSPAMGSHAHLLSNGQQPQRTYSQGVSFAPPATVHSYPSPPTGNDSNPWPKNGRLYDCKPKWHPSYTMYVCFLFGLLCAVGHHIFYASLDGKVAGGQSEMLRYGTILAYAAKAGFSAAVVSAFKQRVWVTVRTRFMSIKALDSMFAAAEDMVSMLNFEFLRDAKGAYALALFAWTTPLIVILTANTLLVEPRTITHSTTCPAVRTLNFSFEETNEWRNETKIDGLFEIPLSIWNTTKRDDNSDPNWFDYYTGPSPALQVTATLGAFLEQVVARQNASYDTCGSGWNCTFTIHFTAPGYSCTEMASGVGVVPKNLTQESGEAMAPFPNTDFLLPRGNYSYYAFTSGGEYSITQMANVGVGGIPNMDPADYPPHLGALRTEPIIWVGYTVLNYPNETQPTRSEPGWDSAFTPKIFACEHRETAYVANFTYKDTLQIAGMASRKFGAPIINTTFLPQVPANDGTMDNTTAVPESNYIYPNDTGRYRRIAAYHSLGKMMRSLINGTVSVSDTLVQPIENTQAIQTKLLDERNNYFPYPNLTDRIQGLYDDLILSVFSNPQFVEVAWAARPDEQSGTLTQGGLEPLGLVGRSDSSEQAPQSSAAEAYMYPCTRFRTANTYAYHRRDLWIVYGIAALVTLICTAAGALAIRENGGVARNTRFSSVLAASRGPALERIAWMGPLQDRGDVPGEVKRLKLGYGILTDMNQKLAAMEIGPDPNLVLESEDEMGTASGQSTGYSPGYGGEMRCGFGLKGDVDQRHQEGSLFHR